MKLGIALSNFSWSVPATEIGPRVTHIAQAADEAGFDSIWTMDHFFQIRVSGEPPEAPMLEAYATLAFVAGQTRRIRLGTAVTSVAYRHPGVLIKAVTSLDVLTGGRMALGVGAGAPWNEPPEGVDPRDLETVGLGIPFPSLAERFDRLEELLQLAHQMWQGDERPYEGKHYQLARPLNSPNALQRPHPPILVAGSGERKTLRLVARYADMCNLFDLPGSGYRDNLKHKLDVLRDHCQDVGRDFAEIEKSTSTFLDLGKDRTQGLRDLLDHLHELADLGIDHVILAPRHPLEDPTIEAVASILPKVHSWPSRAGV